MEALYSFDAYNTERYYGIGTEEEASMFVEWLNRGRDINLFYYDPCSKEQVDEYDILDLREEIAGFPLKLELESMYGFIKIYDQNSFANGLNDR